MAAAAPSTGSAWLYGPVSDLRFGAGLVNVPVFAALALAGRATQDHAGVVALESGQRARSAGDRES